MGQFFSYSVALSKPIFFFYYLSMLRSTATLLALIHCFFDEIDYQPTSANLDGEEIINHLIDTLNHAKELDDALFILRFFKMYLKKENKFLKKFFKYPEFWDEIEYEGRKETNTVSEEEAIGVYHITNALSGNNGSLYICSVSFENGFFAFDYYDGFYSIGEEPKYYLRKSRLSSDELVLTDDNRKVIATIAIDDDTNVYFKNNKTRYELISYNAGVGFYEKKYIYSLDKKEEPDLEKECKAFVQWDIVDDKGNFGLSRLDVYDENADFDLLMMLAASCFLVFKRHLSAKESRSIARGILFGAMISNATRFRRF